jgi:hypothetical protein
MMHRVPSLLASNPGSVCARHDPHRVLRRQMPSVQGTLLQQSLLPPQI